MPVTIADVAARAGVSKTTVSRVLNGRGELDESTAARVRRVIAELGYVPSSRAVGLARGQTSIVALLVPSLTWPWMGDVLQGAVDAIEEAGYGVMLFTWNRGQESMRRFDSQVSARSFDGLVAIEPEGTLDYITELRARGLPVVLIDDRGNSPQFPAVATTNRHGGEQAARHLLEQGRHRPLIIKGIADLGCTEERLAGFAETYAAAGHPIDPELVAPGDFTFDCGRLAAEALLRRQVSFDAVFAHNDQSAVGALSAIQHAGLRVPQDIAVIGFDDLPMAVQSNPPLTTVHQPLREMGETAARLLISSFTGTPLPDRPTVIPTTLVTRASTVPG